MTRERFHREYVGYGGAVVAVRYTGKDGSLISIGNKKAEDLTRLDKFENGCPVFLSDIGCVSALTFRSKCKPEGTRDNNIQDVIVAVSTHGHKSVLFELHYDENNKYSPCYNTLTADRYFTTDIGVKDILPIYFAHQENKEDPDGLVLLGWGDDVKLVQRLWGRCKDKITPDMGRWLRNYCAEELKVVNKSKRIYVTREGRKRLSITDSLRKAGVDIETTIEKLDDFGRWKASDGLF